MILTKKGGKMNKSSDMYIGFRLAAIGMIVATGSVMAAETAAVPTTVVADLPVLSAYVWRGQVLNDEAVIQPAITVTSGGLSLNAWFNANLTDRVTGHSGEFSEVDLTASYSYRIGPVSATAGYLEYMFPNQTVLVASNGATEAHGEALASTREVYLSITAPDWVVVPSLTVYRDIGEAEGIYVLAGLGWTKQLCSKSSLSLSASAAFADATYNAFYFGVDKAALNDGNIGVALAIKASDSLTITPMVQYTVLLDSTVKEGAAGLYKDDNSFFGGVKLTWGL